MAHPATYKPSPLSYGSPRTSPFRRPESPASPFRRADSPSSPSTTTRATTPTPLTSPTKPTPQSPLSSPTKSLFQTPQTSPSKLHQTTTTPTSDTNTTPRNLTPQTSPTRASSASIATAIAATHPLNHTNPGLPTQSTKPSTSTISTLPPTQLRLLRESFQILDRDNDGLIIPSDIADMLSQLSLPSHTQEINRFFPPTSSGPQQTTSLPTFLSTLSTLLAPLSSQQELLNAFAAFDERDSGEIDVGELRDAVLNTKTEAGEMGLSAGEVEEAMGGFVGKRAFGKDVGKGAGSGRGEVFRYREWVGGLMGASEEKDGEK
ncbi:hypothetical protein ACLMJK_006559 [Lecanora helva]